jgi:hypothetical protein
MTDVQPDPSSIDPQEIEAQRARIREEYLRPAADRPASSARGLHHTALLAATWNEPSGSTRTCSVSRSPN